MTSSSINSLGLIFDIAGVVILFYFGPPTLNITRDGHKILPFNSNNDEEINVNKALATKHHILSKLGLSFLLVGFILQLASNSWK